MIVRVQGYPLKLLEITVKSLELRHFLEILSAGGNFDAGFLRQMAERERFEPSVQLPVRRISSAVLSTTQPPLRRGLYSQA